MSTIDLDARTSETPLPQEDRELLRRCGYDLLEEEGTSPYCWCRAPYGPRMVDPAEELAFVRAVGEHRAAALATLTHAKGIKYGREVARRWRDQLAAATSGGPEPAFDYPTERSNHGD
jgi:hypothetical protein